MIFCSSSSTSASSSSFCLVALRFRLHHFHLLFLLFLLLLNEEALLTNFFELIVFGFSFRLILIPDHLLSRNFFLDLFSLLLFQPFLFLGLLRRHLRLFSCYLFSLLFHHFSVLLQALFFHLTFFLFLLFLNSSDLICNPLLLGHLLCKLPSLLPCLFLGDLL